MKTFDQPSADGIELEYALTDGTRVANLHVSVSRTALSVLGLDPWMTEASEELRAWVLDRLQPIDWDGASGGGQECPPT